MRRFPTLLAFLLLPLSAAAVDEFVPYTDGRLGGCYRTEGGELYNCTRDAPKAGSETRREAVPDAPTSAAAAAAESDTRAELEALRRELDALKQERAEEQALRAAARERREQALREAQALEQADADAAMAAYNAIEAAKDSARLEQLQQRTEACRKSLERRGYRIVGAGACRAPDGTYVNCPDC